MMSSAPHDENAAPGRRARSPLAAYLAAVFVVASFLWGYWLGTHKTPSGAGPSGDASGSVEIVNADADRSGGELDFEQFWDLWETVEDRYVRQPVDQKKMFYGAMMGVVASLGDPHSVYLPPDETEEFAKELSGKFEGIGAEIGVKQGNIVIIAPLAASPAEKAGLLPGDQVLAIDGVDTFGMTLDDAVGRIRGDKGTKVKLLVQRAKKPEPLTFEIIRDTIVIQSVKLSSAKSPQGKRLAVIKVSHFNGDTHDKFLDAVSQIRVQEIDGLVLDLRNNPGGFLDTSIRMLGEWTPGEIVVSERYSDGRKDDSRASGRGRLKDLKTVVLVNGGSASASEIMAGALRDLGKATIIGTRTFGKGSVQDLIDFRDGSSVKLTIAEWLTPAGVNINQDGIAPDHLVERTEEDYDADRDPQMDAAKAFFDGVIPPPPEEEKK
jgi:carboxyl-terminal processing protease